MWVFIFFNSYSSSFSFRIQTGDKNPRFLPDVNVVLCPLTCLKHLTIVFGVMDIARALRTAATWSSIRRTDSDSTFRLCFNFRNASRGSLPYQLDRDHLLAVLEGYSAGCHVPFKGKMIFNLLGDVQVDISSLDVSHAHKLAASAGVDTIVWINGEVHGSDVDS